MLNPLTLLALLVAVVAGDMPAQGQDGRQTLIVGGLTRTYIATVPPEVLAAGIRVPMVIALHGGGGNAENAMMMTGFDRKAMEEGFIAVFPDGGGRTMLKTWNSTHCCGTFSLTSGIDDVAFISALIDEMIARYPVDPARVYVTGMSNGGMMTHQLAIALPGKIAAIAPVVGTLFGDEIPSGLPVPAMIFNGALDTIVPPAGGSLGLGIQTVGAWDGTLLLPAVRQGEFWAANNGCAPVPTVTETAAFVLTVYNCPQGADVRTYLVKGMGHAWPGGIAGRPGADDPTDLLGATDLMWEFFRGLSRSPTVD